MTTTRPLGTTQQSILRSMTRRGSDSVWYDGCGWVWTTANQTAKLLDSLERRGLVSKTVVHIEAHRFGKHGILGRDHDRTVYRLTEAGIEAAKMVTA